MKKNKIVEFGVKSPIFEKATQRHGAKVKKPLAPAKMQKRHNKTPKGPQEMNRMLNPDE
jgi:hypothetical protein